MVNRREISSDPYDPLKQEIQTFLNKNPYCGFSNPFILEELRADDLATQTRPSIISRIVVLKGLREEDLGVIDREWLKGLSEVGKRWEMVLRLPYWYFEK